MLQWGVVTGASLAAAILDVLTRKIPNWLTGPVALGGAVSATYFAGFAGLADSLCGGLLAAMPFLLLFILAGGGGGDVKMMAANGTWLGLLNGLAALAAVCVAGIILALIISLIRRRFSSLARGIGLFVYGAMSRQAPHSGNPAHPGDKMPYGPAIFTGVLAAAIGMRIWHGF